MSLPLMPKATAVWLIDKTSLSFDQIAAFVGMHPLEIQAIADGEVAIGIVGHDPIASGQLTREEIARCEGNPDARLKLAESSVVLPKPKGKGARYTRAHPPLRVLGFREYADRAAASRAEWQLKRQPRGRKLAWLEHGGQ